MSKRSIRRRSVRLAKKVWNVVLNNNNKDQRKSRSVRSTKISDDSSNDDDDDGGHTLSVSSNDSSQYEPQIVDVDPVVESSAEEDVDVESCCMSQSMDVENHDVEEENNHDVTELYVHDDTSSVTEKDNSSLPAVTAPGHIDESAHEDGDTSKEGSKAESEELLERLTDNTSQCDDEGAGTVSQSQGIDQQLCQEEFNEENVFVDVAAVVVIHQPSYEGAEAHINLEESVHEDGDTSKEGSKVESEELLETLKDNTSCADEGAGIVSQPQGIDQQLCQEEFSEENAFVEGAAVHIIKGTNRGKRGIISRVTSKCAFISIDGFDKDVRKTKSIEFLEIANQEEICSKQYHNSDPQESFLLGNLVRIKKGAHKDCQGIISRITEKCVFISIRGLSKEIRKKKSIEFLEILNDGTDCAPQDINQQACAEESREVNDFVVGMQVRIVKGNHLGNYGVISRLTSKCAFVSIEGVAKDIRKTKSDQFLQIVKPIDEQSHENESGC
eukprot:scaffold9511_cov182-Skeletonema_dohrnii-CCMP3373.AAC.2